MKIKPEHFTEMSRAIRELVVSGKSQEIFETIKRDGRVRVKDVDIRFRWDLLWAAVKTPSWPPNLMRDIYSYADDTHIDTALKKIVKKYGI